MKKTRTTIIKAGLALVFAALFLMPAVSADVVDLMNLLKKSSSIVEKDVVVVPSVDDCAAPEGILLNNAPSTTTVVPLEGSSLEMELGEAFGGGTLDPPGGSGFCGALESINQYGYANALNWVHTYNPNPPPPLRIMTIHAPLFIKETRHDRTTAYVVAPTIDHKENIGDSQWCYGPILAGYYVWEDDYYSYSNVLTYSFGKASATDHIYPFRTHIYIYNEVYRWYDDNGVLHAYFELAQEVLSSTGLWFYDVYPYTSSSSSSSSTSSPTATSTSTSSYGYVIESSSSSQTLD